MQSKYYGQIDLDNLFTVAKEQKGLVKTYKDKNGNEHHVINVVILLKDTPDKYNNVASIKIDCKSEEVVEALKQSYWIGNLKESTAKEAAQPYNWDKLDYRFPWEK